MCNRGRRGDRVVFEEHIHDCVFDQIPKIQNCFTPSDKNLGGEVASDR